jgi:hypothetical protein
VDFDLRVSFVVVTNTGEEIQFFQRRGKKSVEKFARRERFDERIFEPFLSMIFFFFLIFFFSSLLFFSAKKKRSRIFCRTQRATQRIGTRLAAFRAREKKKDF